MRRIAVGADERAPVTDVIVEELRRRGFEVELHGALREGDDPRWPLVAQRVAEQVARGAADQGVLFCWTGTGVCMTANKVPGVRAALCDDAETARGARLWNDANVLCLSLRRAAPPVAKEVLDAWLDTEGPDPSERENIRYVEALDAAKQPGRALHS